MDANTTTGKKKLIAFRIVAACLGVLFVLLAAEIALRVAYMADPSRHGGLRERLEKSRDMALPAKGGSFSLNGLVQPSDDLDIVYELKPGLEGTFCGKSLRINAHGFRGREYAPEKPPNTRRIVGLGDSVMFGWGVDQDESYLAVVEQRLNDLPAPHPAWEVLNFAVPGYNTTMEVATFEQKALAFDPDVVILHVIGNDFGVPHFMWRPDQGLSMKKSYLWELLRTRLGWIRQDLDEDLIGHDLDGLEDEERADVLRQYRHMVGEEAFFRALEKLAALAQERGITVIVIHRESSDRQMRVLAHLKQQYNVHTATVGAYTDAYCAEHGIPDTKEARRKLLWVSPGDRHPNAIGHAIYADMLMDALRDAGAAP
ncbi:MAG: SGNH/GDSL hydrolase family protein [Kiritimatiellae bacterium]|nr:SGNH/GDSL hydrolase family protein [Kiritimatiellia bacterium]